jgi:hypothetical protein
MHPSKPLGCSQHTILQSLTFSEVNEFKEEERYVEASYRGAEGNAERTPKPSLVSIRKA